MGCLKGLGFETPFFAFCNKSLKRKPAEQMTDEESKTFDLFAVRTKITAISPHHRTLFPVCGASPKEKPKHAVIHTAMLRFARE